MSWIPAIREHKTGHSKAAKWSPDDPRRKKKLRKIHHQQQEKQHGHQAPHLAHHQPKHPSAERMGRGELYEYYKRQGLLEVYFRLFPNG
jgi:hypothetical protein